MPKKRHIAAAAALLACTAGAAQKAYNLTADEVRTGKEPPCFVQSYPLAGNHADSVYTAEILFPEYVELPKAEAEKAWEAFGGKLPQWPEITQTIVTERKKAMLRVAFCPIIERGGKAVAIASFSIGVKSAPRGDKPLMAKRNGEPEKTSRYADHSVLAGGKWAKIRIPATGIYELTAETAKKAGFTDLSKVKVYGYGGALQNETLVADELAELDDLKEIPTCNVGGKRLFYGVGPVNWDSPTAVKRTRNPYSDYGYYFITEDGTQPAEISAEEFAATTHPTPWAYHSLHEVDNYSWFHGGRNIFENSPIHAQSSKTYTIAAPKAEAGGSVTVALTAGANSTAEVKINGETAGTMAIKLGSYDKGNETVKTFYGLTLEARNEVAVKTLTGGPVRLDYISINSDKPADAPDLQAGGYPQAEYAGQVENQDLHAHGPADMVIIIPASGKLKAQAERLAEMHSKAHGLRCRIVRADHILNEFASGTPDANAYRRYLKMLYDRAETEADLPRFLLLMGDCFWDNRMNSFQMKGATPDDYLLCFESENSFNEVNCYVDDGFFALLDDGEGANPQSKDLLDLAVGRFPVSTESQAKAMVDKTLAYVENANAGAWQNTVVFMGDDGNFNLHMKDLNATADTVAKAHPGYLQRKVMWDAYKRVTGAAGNSYPEATTAIKAYQAEGALIMDYSGHGSETQISHESVLKLTDFKGFTNKNLPLWITASCDIMPFDGIAETIGETAVTNPAGGAVAFFGTTRTVYTNYNKAINTAFLKHVLGKEDGKPVTIGEAQTRAKNQMVTARQDLTNNKLQYSLLGDPAITLNLPTLRAVVDSIDGKPATETAAAQLSPGSVVRLKGHVEGAPGFTGTVHCTVMDSEESITCKKNDPVETTTAFVYKDRTKTVFTGVDSVRAGQFEIVFSIPKDLNYKDGNGMVKLHAVDKGTNTAAHGSFSGFTLGGDLAAAADSVGPSVFCYLNTPSFTNGATVGAAPYFVAQITDKDGINATGNGIGHDLQVTIDGDPQLTYNLNGNFAFDFGSYTSGQTYLQLPVLPKGEHTLEFKAWDILNNPTTCRLAFNVEYGMEPQITGLSCTRNPARDNTTFIISHDCGGTPMDVEVDVMDSGGRLMWRTAAKGVSSPGVYTIDWDLTSGGSRLPAGLYTYRARVSADGSGMVSQTRKLVITRQ